MTIRKNADFHLHAIPVRSIAAALALAGLAGCTSVGNLLEGERIDYKSATEKSKTPRLEIPPDLTKLQRDNRYAIPESNKGVATASGYSLDQATKPVETAAAIAPKTNGDIRVERDGSQRWLVVKLAPEVLWPQIKDFWQDAGFVVNIDSPETGVMETDWAENRAKIPQDFIRNALGSVLDSLYSTGERDKFRTRLERNADGSTDIFISHRGAEEVLTGSQKDSSVWTARPSDPGLEAEFLSRLMQRLGTEEAKAKVAVATAPTLQARSKLVKNPAGNSVQVDESFERSWRRVGLALDRVGFTVEDRDRSQGVYFVRYVDQAVEAKDKESSGWLSNIFSRSKDKDKSAVRYRIAIKASGDGSVITVQNNNGQPEISSSADKILGLLNDQLK
ncbi:outer membrane protein assembly factor BamC [Herbaspirillum sp. RTI4]|uniref:outer membrane protein assembly factor BamC n=1 Tax=Herbaspirillum sp. RTI4 TaxID=3048640 RepID=UPI002AB5A748|nr:outer membrane protein assembly factor BamC [Herbaspirillum sp. RTI4]MDY7578056.1 outer membrane protein assembly factor BamC [Herbaspirillum sp. RTI4]MEA9983186.1 outer membrane protein assembly factor BamC [Herbaspirillum sp. RTI4]